MVTVKFRTSAATQAKPHPYSAFIHPEIHCIQAILVMPQAVCNPIQSWLAARYLGLYAPPLVFLLAVLISFGSMCSILWPTHGPLYPRILWYGPLAVCGASNPLGISEEGDLHGGLAGHQETRADFKRNSVKFLLTQRSLLMTLEAVTNNLWKTVGCTCDPRSFSGGVILSPPARISASFRG